MTPADFRAWRKRLDLTQKQAADLLGLSLSSISQYESGKRRDNGRPVTIPRTVELATRGLEQGKES